jgi:hypothetical protein
MAYVGAINMKGNDKTHRFTPSNRMAHSIDEHYVEILKDLVVEQGNDAKNAVGKSARHWAQYEAQYILRNDDTHHFPTSKANDQSLHQTEAHRFENPKSLVTVRDSSSVSCAVSDILKSITVT